MPKHLNYANYSYSLTAAQQEAIQIWLRLLPANLHDEIWEMVHHLTYADSWTDKPQHQLYVGKVGN